MNDPFRPTGPTVVVDNTARQVTSSTSSNDQQYRIRCTAASAAYFTYSTANITGGGTPSMTLTAPVAGTPQANTIGMLPNSVEVFTLPAGAWFLAAAANFEVTPGEGA